MGDWLGLPVQASAHAGEIDQMIILIHYLMFILFIGWGIYFVWVLIRFRAKANPRGRLHRRDEPHLQLPSRLRSPPSRRCC